MAKKRLTAEDAEGRYFTLRPSALSAVFRIVQKIIKSLSCEIILRPTYGSQLSKGTRYALSQEIP